MDKETIKQQNSMRDVLNRYGMVPNRAGFIKCPFHSGDRTASMKIYKDSYYCFGCGATGDIFTFVQNMDNCDFKTAFTILGGTYQKPNFSSRISIYHHQKQMEMRQKNGRKRLSCKNACLILTFIGQKSSDGVLFLTDGVRHGTHFKKYYTCMGS